MSYASSSGSAACFAESSVSFLSTFEGTRGHEHIMRERLET